MPLDIYLWLACRLMAVYPDAGAELTDAGIRPSRPSVAPRLRTVAKSQITAAGDNIID